MGHPTWMFQVDRSLLRDSGGGTSKPSKLNEVQAFEVLTNAATPRCSEVFRYQFWALKAD